MLEFLIKKVLSWLAGINAQTWEQAVRWVIDAETDLESLKTGAERKEWVATKIRAILPQIKNLALNILIELAVGFASKKGWVSTSIK